MRKTLHVAATVVLGAAVGLVVLLATWPYKSLLRCSDLIFDRRVSCDSTGSLAMSLAAGLLAVALGAALPRMAARRRRR